jgi:hypothetical protein
MYTHLMLHKAPPVERVQLQLWLQSTFAYTALWLSLLYVVVEGWEDLGLHDPVVDPLIASPHRDLLRRFRNGAFHFQQDYFDQRFTDFLDDASSAWAKQVHKGIGDWFLAQMGVAADGDVRDQPQ